MDQVLFEQEEQDVFKRFRFNPNVDKPLDFVLYQVLNGKIEVAALGEPGSTFDDFKSKIMEFGNDAGLYCLRRFMVNAINTPVLVKWIPDSLPVAAKMVFCGSGLDAVLDVVGKNILKINTTTESELDEDAIISQIS